MPNVDLRCACGLSVTANFTFGDQAKDVVMSWLQYHRDCLKPQEPEPQMISSCEP